MKYVRRILLVLAGVVVWALITVGCVAYVTDYCVNQIVLAYARAWKRELEA